MNVNDEQKINFNLVNAEALANPETGTASCTGEKYAASKTDNRIICHCENTAPCMDLYGCN